MMMTDILMVNGCVMASWWVLVVATSTQLVTVSQQMVHSIEDSFRLIFNLFSFASNNSKPNQSITVQSRVTLRDTYHTKSTLESNKGMILNCLIACKFWSTSSYPIILPKYLHHTTYLSKQNMKYLIMMEQTWKGLNSIISMYISCRTLLLISITFSSKQIELKQFFFARITNFLTISCMFSCV